MAKEPVPGEKGTAEPAEQPQRAPIHLDDSKALACYANFCRVTGTPEEVILDLALNDQPFGNPTEPIMVTQRVIMNYYTAKRMLAALHQTVQMHESRFGVLETDVGKRIQRPAR